MFKLNEFKSPRCSKKYVYIPEKLVGTAEMSLNSKPKLGKLGLCNMSYLISENLGFV